MEANIGLPIKNDATRIKDSRKSNSSSHVVSMKLPHRRNPNEDFHRIEDSKSERSRSGRLSASSLRFIERMDSLSKLKNAERSKEIKETKESRHDRIMKQKQKKLSSMTKAFVKRMEIDVAMKQKKREEIDEKEKSPPAQTTTEKKGTKHPKKLSKKTQAFFERMEENERKQDSKFDAKKQAILTKRKTEEQQILKPVCFINSISEQYGRNKGTLIERNEKFLQEREEWIEEKQLKEKEKVDQMRKEANPHITVKSKRRKSEQNVHMRLYEQGYIEGLRKNKEIREHCENTTKLNVFHFTKPSLPTESDHKYTSTVERARCELEEQKRKKEASLQIRLKLMKIDQSIKQRQFEKNNEGLEGDERSDSYEDFSEDSAEIESSSNNSTVSD